MNKTILAAIAAAATLVGAEELLGAGATFPYPLYSKMFATYFQERGTKVNYQSIGSGGGVKQILSETVDFGASDAFVDDKQLGQAKRKLIHIPMALGAVTVTYNLPGVKALKLTPEVLANIFLGKITSWDDPAIKGLNPGFKSNGARIVVVRRSDGSGTTNIFTDYLSEVSPEWKTSVGAGKSVNWPTGLGAKGNEGVAGLVRQTPGAIGYVELSYTIQNKMEVASIRNKAGNFIYPDLASTSLAADAEIPADTRVSLVNPDAVKGYPIAGFTWILVYQDQKYGDRSKAKAQALARLLWWMTHEGQAYCEPLQYSKLPSKALTKAEVILKGLNWGGEPLLP